MKLILKLSVEQMTKLIENKGHKVFNHAFGPGKKTEPSIKIGNLYYRIENAVNLLYPTGTTINVEGFMTEHIIDDSSEILHQTAKMIYDQAKVCKNQFSGVFWDIVITRLDKVFKTN